MKAEVCDQVRQDFRPFLDQLSEKYGLSFELGTMRYDSAGFQATFKATDESEHFAMHCHNWGLKPEAFGFEYMDRNGETFTLVGFNLKARSMPIRLRRMSDGAMVKARETFLARIPVHLKIGG